MRLDRIKPRTKLLLMAAGGITLILIGAIAGAVVLLSGAYSTAATKQHFLITHRLLDIGLEFSVRQRAGEITAPDNLHERDMIERGAACYRQHCTQCHGSPLAARDDEGKGMLPTPSSLPQAAREWPAEWLFFVTSKGVRMTGMPAWEFRISEESRWATVAFLKQYPFLTRDDYLALSEAALDRECPPSTELPEGDRKEAAAILLRQYSCHSCHQIQGVVGPVTHVGPPLIAWKKRKYIAGMLPNTTENLVHWIRHPREISPDTLMPDLSVTEPHARFMAAYLMELE